MTLVVKIGGSRGIDLSSIARDIAALHGAGRAIVVAHGGSDVANRLAARLGHPAQFLDSVSGVRSRYTDVETLGILTMALSGVVKPDLVARMVRLGVPAVGLSGLDAGMVEAQRKRVVKVLQDGRTRIIRDDHTGKIERINARVLNALLAHQFVPVISPPVLDKEDGTLNVDADRLAAAIAGAVQAEALVILSNVPGLLRDRTDPRSLIRRVEADSLDECMELAQGRMKLKVVAAAEALAAGVNRVIISDSATAQPVRDALAGRGTLFESIDQTVAELLA